MTFFTPIGPIDLIVFDLDGTLVDTKDDIVDAFEWTLAQYGIEVGSRASIEGLVGNGVQDELGRRLGENKTVNVEQALLRFRSRYRANLTTRSRPFPGVPELLARVAPLPLVVLTNKPENLARDLLRELGLASRFAKIYGAEAFATKKPDPEPLLRICERLSIEPRRTLIVGDSRNDIRCGQSAGAQTGAVLYGYGDRAELEALKPDFTASSVHDLTQFFHDSSSNSAQRLGRVIEKSSRRIIGLMSGMSMDGVDLACADIGGSFPNLSVTFLSSHFMPYPEDLRQRLLSSRDACTREVSELNVQVARAFAECVEQFLLKTGLGRGSIDAIGSHGQTLFHATDNAATASTLQVGSTSIIAELTGLLTIGNFRVRDIAAGGHGAPLVALADYVLFRHDRNTLALHNLGSISNITVVTPELEGLMSFDSGPANIAIDHYARQMPNNPHGLDVGGSFSQQGRCIPELLDRWMNVPFFSVAPPKAAGYADFAISLRSDLDRPIEDHLRTAVEYAALTIAQAYRRFVLPRHPSLKIIKFSGGGTYNLTLMNRIRELLPEFKIEILARELSDAKEALAFAILANETLSGRPGSFPSTTGVRKPVVLGEIAL